MAEWTTNDQSQAESEGWAIVDSRGSDNGPWQLQRFDDPAAWGWPDDKPYPFHEDTDVWLHVMQRMRKGSGSPLHLRAILFLREHNRMEYDAIHRWETHAREHG